MWEEFWKTYYELKADSCYFHLYAIRTKRIKIFVSAICLLSSSSFLLSWYYSDSNSLLWSILLFASQLIAVLQPLFPYDLQNRAACYIFEDLEELLLEVEQTRRRFLSGVSDEELSECISRFEGRYNTIVMRFAKPDTFPQKSRLMKKAEKEANLYFQSRR